MLEADDMINEQNLAFSLLLVVSHLNVAHRDLNRSGDMTLWRAAHDDCAMILICDDKSTYINHTTGL